MGVSVSSTKIKKIGQYIQIKKLGRGGFGEVFLVQNCKNMPFALKKISMNRYYKQKTVKQAIIAVSLEHQNIIKTREFFLFDQQAQLAIVMEYCPEGSLADNIGKINQTQRLKLIKGIVKGMLYLHDSKSIIHRDIKPQNILIKNGIPKIADLGLARILSTRGAVTRVGTKMYEPPEISRSQTYSFSADIWSLGITFIEILLGNRIWKYLQIDQFPNQIKDFPNDDLMKKINNEKIKKLLKQMLNIDPSKRPTINKIYQEIQNNQQRILQNHNLNVEKKQKQKKQSKLTLKIKQQAQKIQKKKINKKYTSKIKNLEHQIQNNLMMNQKEKENIGKIYESNQLQLFQMVQFVKYLTIYQFFPNLQKICVQSSQLTDEGLKFFAENSYKFPKLEKISFQINKITDKGLKFFTENCSKFPKLQVINLQINKITGKGLKFFAQNSYKFPNLKQIDLNDNQIEDEGLKTFAENSYKLPNLRKIYFGGNKITGEGLKAFAENSSIFSHLQQIYFGDNKITSKGLQAFAINSFKFPSLQKISFQINNITGKALKNFAENSFNFPDLQQIDFNDNQITDEGLKAFAENSSKFVNLQKIYFGANKITGEGLKIFAENSSKFSKLQQIYFGDNQITDEGLNDFMKNIKKFPIFQQIFLRCNQIQSAKFKNLRNL